MEIKEIINELTKWAEADKENRSLLFIAADSSGEEVEATTCLVGNPRYLVEVYCDPENEAARKFEKVTMVERLYRRTRGLLESFGDALKDFEKGKSETEE